MTSSILGKRMRVWSGASEEMIYDNADVNFAFRAWHDLCHWKGQFPFTLEGKIATCEMQCRQLIDFHGDNEVTRNWCTILKTRGHRAGTVLPTASSAPTWPTRRAR
jgi:hypothetical protein